MSELGNRLKKERMTKKISLDEFAKFTKISSKYLKALETGDFKKLPAPVYVQGILRVYAERFGLELHALALQYKDELQGPGILEKGGKKVEEPSKPIRTPRIQMITPRILSYTATLLFAGFVALYLFYQFNVLHQNPRLRVVTPESNFITAQEMLEIKGRVDPPDSVITINNQVIEQNERGEFETKISLVSGSNIFEIKAIDKYGKSSVVTRKVFRE